jgi:hypothetical protein
MTECTLCGCRRRFSRISLSQTVVFSGSNAVTRQVNGLGESKDAKSSSAEILH